MARIRSSKLLEILLPNLLINLEGISHEDELAATDDTTGDWDVTKLPGWRNRIDPEARSATAAFLEGYRLARLHEDPPDPPALVDALLELGRLRTPFAFEGTAMAWRLRDTLPFLSSLERKQK